MRRALLLIPFAASALQAAEPVAPEPFPDSRYAALMANPPFTLATATQPTVVKPSFAANLYITGVARIGDRDFVTISTRDRTARFSLFSGESSANSEGIEIVKVDWSDEVGRGKVSVKKNGEFALLEFDQAELSKSPGATSLQPAPRPAGISAPPPVPISPGGPSATPRRRTLIIPSAPR